jgi:glycosyltransferase involved in cell wall biosynthesis
MGDKISSDNKQALLTIIIPAFNEEEGIGDSLDKLLEFVKELNFEILVVNDGSTDNTQAIVEAKNVRLINHPNNKGYGAALKTGIKASNTEYIATYDADGQHNPEDLYNLWKNIGVCDMLVGMRGKDSYQEWVRKPGKWLLKKAANFLTGRKIPDLNSGLRIIKRDQLINKLHLFSNSFSFSTTSTVAFMSMGCYVDYYPIKVNKRVGKSTVKQLKHGTSTLMIILRMVVLYNPLKVFLPISFTAFILGLAWGIYGYLTFSRFSNSAILVTLMGVLIFFMGLLSDQISILNRKE